jgi:hypothetical protein
VFFLVISIVCDQWGVTYVVSFIPFHERGFGMPVSRFMRVLPHYYGVELHNFNPNSIA